jgi:hypothetical protein
MSKRGVTEFIEVTVPTGTENDTQLSAVYGQLAVYYRDKINGQLAGSRS